MYLEFTLTSHFDEVNFMSIFSDMNWILSILSEMHLAHLIYWYFATYCRLQVLDSYVLTYFYLTSNLPVSISLSNLRPIDTHLGPLLDVIGLNNFLCYVLPQIIVPMEVQSFDFYSLATFNHYCQLFSIVLLPNTSLYYVNNFPEDRLNLLLPC